MQGGGYDIPLNDMGEEQARCAAEALSGIPLDVVASSHLLRAKQTADAVHAAQTRGRSSRNLTSASSPPSRLVMAEFGEMRFGDLEGTAIHGPEATDNTRSRYAEIDDAMTEEGHLSWPGDGGESTYQVEERAIRGFSQLLASSEDGDRSHLAVVAHGRHNKVLLASLLRGEAREFKAIKQGNACINVFDWDEVDGIAVEVLVNYVNHAELDERHS